MGNFEHRVGSCIGRYRDMTNEDRYIYKLLPLTTRTDEALGFQDRCEREKEQGEKNDAEVY